jgi:hypothetical protein
MQDMRSQLDRFIKLKKEYEDKIHEERSKIRLIQSLESKIRTTMIGSLAAMEKYFGSVWAQGKAISEMTDEELKFFKIKEQMRKDIFDLGNKNIRNVGSELQQYDVSWNKFNITFERND